MNKFYIVEVKYHFKIPEDNCIPKAVAYIAVFDRMKINLETHECEPVPVFKDRRGILSNGSDTMAENIKELFDKTRDLIIETLFSPSA